MRGALSTSITSVSSGVRRSRGLREDYLTDTPRGFRFEVFDREGEPCRQCGRLLRHATIGQRASVWCAYCQR